MRLSSFGFTAIKPIIQLTLILKCFALLFSSSVLAATLPKASPVPGGIALVPISSSGTGTERPTVTFKDRQVMVVNTAGTAFEDRAPWLAVVGLGLDLEPGPHHLHLGSTDIAFEVHDKQYKEQRLTIKNKRQVNPNEDDLKRIRRESKEILGALGRWSETANSVTQLQKPAEGPYSSPFGLRRFFNDQPRRPHSGLDIAAPHGSPIVAPAPGEVVATGDYFFNGRTVILDHGQGLTTMYNHMDRIDVTLGQQVKTGEQLGTIGKTGRVTGPHLHWSVSLNNERVNPSLFLP